MSKHNIFRKQIHIKIFLKIQQTNLIVYIVLFCLQFVRILLLSIDVRNENVKTVNWKMHRFSAASRYSSLISQHR